MAVFKCKMCGGTIEFEQGDTVGVCDCCGTKQTLPKVNDEVIANLFNRANNLRLKAEFDKASEIYEKILNEDNTIAEAHWGVVLCKYGIEYVEDPSTFKRVPTCHRAQYESIMTDDDYIAAIENSDAVQQGIYTQQALEISAIQKNILAIVNEEKPFDVFICYKETDENGKRTVDSALANDIYYQLTQEGLKVFYAAITLEDKLGKEYEPYIFAALQSAKVMLAVGTKPEHFEAVWVKNEWSRFLKLMKTDRSKLLIPCYRDMDAYDLPEEFAHLQAQNMSKIGFVNDIVRGIKKVTGGGEKAQSAYAAPPAEASGGNVASLLKRAFMFLEDGKWSEANEYCEKVLDQDPECAEAYLGKLMAELGISSKDNLRDAGLPFDNNDNAVKAGRFDPVLAEKFKADNDYIRERIETARKQKIYDNAAHYMNSAKTETYFMKAADGFASIKGFKDADEKAEDCRKEAIYVKAKRLQSTTAYKSAIELYSQITDWKDSREKLDKCKREYEEQIKKEEKKKEIAKKFLMIAVPAFAAMIAFFIVLNAVILPASNYKKALTAANAGNYDMAIILFKNNLDYKDTGKKIEECYIGKYGEEKWNAIKAIKVGDSYMFGSYEQDNDTSNGEEEIEWRVLAKEDNRILVISKYALDCQQYNKEETAVTWETCSLRKWLNDSFINSAFSSMEQEIIMSSIVKAEKNPSNSTDPGKDTTDKVFLLSITEAVKYFSDDDDRMCVPTACAIEQGAYTNSFHTKSGKNACIWLLRSPGYASDYAAYVDSDGYNRNFGGYVNYGHACVRPALWIEI